MEVFENIPFEPDVDDLLSNVHVDRASRDAADLQELLETARRAAKPKATCEVSYIDDKSEDSVVLSGVKFTSRVLRVNLDKAERAFPFIATCGRELDEIDIPPDDFIRRYWLDVIKGMALGAAMKYLTEQLKDQYALPHIASMSPGDADHAIWPIEQQRQLFLIFGDTEELIGVRLTDSFLMIPNKSVSGIYFPTEVNFESCKLCPREVCPGRRAPYDKNLLEAYKTGKV